MENKICIITGANAGLGYESAKALAAKGATIIMVCRSKEKGVTAQNSIISATQNEQVHLVLADLSLQSEVRQAAQKIQDQFPRVDVLMNNAGAVTSKQIITSEGIDTQFAVNHLAGFLLTHLLMPQLLKSADARVVNISSGNHFRGQMHFEDLYLSEDYQVLKAYNQSKLANVLFTYELDRKLKEKGMGNIVTNAVNPGLNYTDIGTKSTGFFHALAWRLRRLVAMSPAKGAECQVLVASSDELKGVSGKYWYESKAVPSSKDSYDQSLATKLWEVSLQLCAIDDFFGNF